MTKKFIQTNPTIWVKDGEFYVIFTDRHDRIVSVLIDEFIRIKKVITKNYKQFNNFYYKIRQYNKKGNFGCGTSSDYPNQAFLNQEAEQYMFVHPRASKEARLMYRRIK